MNTTLNDRIAQVLALVFNLMPNEIPADFSIDNTDEWTSLTHLTIILSLEEEFNVEFTDQESIELVSFQLIYATLLKKGIS